MNSNKNLNVAKVNQDDEFYTLRDNVDYIMDPLKEGLTLVILPCDGEQSNFTKYCNENNILHHNMDEFNKLRWPFDCYNIKKVDIITNPPFSKLADFIEACLAFKDTHPHVEVNITFIAPVVVSSLVFKKYLKLFHCYRIKDKRFIHNNKEAEVNTCLYSTYDHVDGWKGKEFKKVDPIDPTYTFFKKTDVALTSIKDGLVKKDYIYTTRAAIVAEQAFNSLGWYCDFDSGYNMDVVKSNPLYSSKFGMIKFIKKNK